MRACWLKWVGRDWSISADYIWLNYSDANTGSLLIHDFERARGVLVRDGGLESEARRADDNDPVYLERLEMVNDLYSRLKH